MKGPARETSEQQAEAITASALVGRNVRRFRLARDWTFDRLCDELAVLGCAWPPDRVESTEAGSIEISVTEILGLSVALGVAPQLLLYPPANVRVALSSDAPIAGQAAGPEDELIDAETHVSGTELADWLWSPDDHPNTHANVIERASWERALGQPHDGPDRLHREG